MESNFGSPTSDSGWEYLSDEIESTLRESQNYGGSSHEVHEIPPCVGLSREQWAKKEVTLVDGDGKSIAAAIVQFVNKSQCPDGTVPLGDAHVGVVVCECFTENSGVAPHSLRRWPIRQALYEGVSLYDQERRDNANLAAMVASKRGRSGKRKYKSSRISQHQESSTKKFKVLKRECIDEALRSQCCDRRCMSQFLRGDLVTLRSEMYLGDYKAKNATKLNVHRSFHLCPLTQEHLCVVEGKVVCTLAWRILYDVSTTDFYRYASLARSGRRPQCHGSTGKTKISPHTLQAVQSMEVLLQSRADSMPHKTHTLQTGEKIVRKVLPTGTKWKDILAEVNAGQTKIKMKKVSQSSCSKIRKKFFSDYEIKRRGDGFARCGKCDQLIRMRNLHAPGTAAYNIIQSKYERHLREQEAARAAYYLSRALACHRPLKVLSVMHDKMDHSKTSSPCFAAKSKATDGLTKLPVSVTGILAHGHGDEKYAHYTLDLYPSDSNQTIGSIAKLLRDLEEPPKSSNPSCLFEGAGRTPMFDAILQGAEVCIDSLPMKPIEHVEFRPLPPTLHIQLDNCWKDNKSRFVMCFWSMLVAKEIFEEIQVSFMLVGHTHDDIDASFGRWSMKLREEDCPTIPLLMKSYMDVDDDPVIPTLIEEVPDFKSFIEDFISDDDLLGHSQGRQFLFYRREDGWPLMKYKLCCTDRMWLPEEGIKLWKENADGSPKLPIGVPRPVPPRLMKGHDDIERGIAGFIEHWKVLCGRENSLGANVEKYSRLVQYWSEVLAALQEKDVEGADVLLFGFWPRTRQSFDVLTVHDEEGHIREEFDVDDHYIGPRSLRPPQSFRVGRDCFCGYFLLARPADDSSAPIWLGEAMSDPILSFGNVNFKNIRVKWYKPVSRRGFQDMPYQNWDTKDNFKWEIDEKYPEQWLCTDSILTAWKSRRHSATATVTIPKQQVLNALDNICRSMQDESSYEPGSSEEDNNSECEA